jgi:pyrimidine deaminase RibD-like protein
VLYVRGVGNVTTHEFVAAGRELADSAIMVDELIVAARAALARIGTRHAEGIALQKALEHVS